MRFPAPSGLEVERVIAAGSVFLVASGRRADERVICKRLLPRMRHEPLAQAAAEREIRALSLARHRALPRLLHHGADEHGPFIVQSLAEGTALAELVEGGPLPGPLLAAVLRASFSALHEIHRLADDGGPLELALGDLSPDDLVIGKRRDQLWFVDLGQASWRDQAAGEHERGTPPYVPPEVARGEVRWDQTADVFALAALMAHAATGREPSVATGPARLAEIGDRGLALSRLAQSSVVSARDREVLLAALANERQARLVTAEAVLRALG